MDSLSLGLRKGLKEVELGCELFFLGRFFLVRVDGGPRHGGRQRR